MIEELVILTKIIFITLILTADNAVIVGSIAANFVPKNRKQIILWGVIGAFVFKIFFAIFATYLFEFYFVKILGGILLIWIVNDLRRDLFNLKKIKSPTKVSKEPSFVQSVFKVLFADITLSFDNVIAVVGAAKDNFNLMIFGLVMSVLLVVTLARFFAEQIKKHKWFGYLGLFAILIVALQLIIGGLHDLGVISINKSFERLF